MKNKLRALAGVSAASVGAAHAELSTAVSGAITGAGTDLATAGGLVITAMAAFWGLRLLGKKLGLWS